MNANAPNEQNIKTARSKGENEEQKLPVRWNGIKTFKASRVNAYSYNM